MLSQPFGLSKPGSKRLLRGWLDYRLETGISELALFLGQGLCGNCVCLCTYVCVCVHTCMCAHESLSCTEASSYACAHMHCVYMCACACESLSCTEACSCVCAHMHCV